MSTPHPIKMPQLSDTMTEGVIVSWEKNIGDPIARGTVVATVETDKAIMDVEVFKEGYLSGPRANVDSVIAVGEAIAYIVATASEVQQGSLSPPAATTTPTTAALSSPEMTHLMETPPGSSSIPAPVASPAPAGALHAIKMPQLSDTMTEGLVVEWAKQPGDKIARGDIVAQVETDKAIMDVEVFKEGYLSGPIAAVDSVVAVGEAMAYLVATPEEVLNIIRTPGAAASPLPPAGEGQGEGVSARPPSPGPTGHPLPQAGEGRAVTAPAPRPAGQAVTPYARQLAGALSLDLQRVRGSGPGGAIVAQDVLAAQPAARAAALPEVIVPGQGRPMTAMERAVSASMTGSLTMPTFHVTVNAEPAALIKAAKAAGVSVTVAIAKACALAMAKHPNMNWCYQPVDKLIERAHVDIGMAVAADTGGLVVPVLRGCESKDLATLDHEWKDLVARARVRRLKPEEYAHPTFMVSNMGMLGVAYFDAIPTPGTAAILAISTAGPQGMPLTITADHRVVNGADAARYLNTLKGYLEQPQEWMMSASGPAIPAGTWDYDVIVIGGGPGGEDCARELAEHGLKVAMINDAPLPGGECLWRGCIPSKAWRAAADRLRDRAHDAHLGVTGTTQGKLNWNALEETRRKVLETRGEMALKTDTGVKIKVIQGYGRLESAHSIFVDTSKNTPERHRRPAPGDGSQGHTLSFGAAVIATGAPPFVPPIPGVQTGLDSGGVLTSDTVWWLPQTPARLGIIGGGAIGLEMAQIFQDFGSEVVLLEARDRILVEVEPEIAKTLTGILNQDPRLTIHTSVKITEIKGKPGAMSVVYDNAAGARQTLAVDYVILATGKRPLLTPLQLDKAGIAVENHAIQVNARCATSVPHIYAVGDVNGGYMLAHTAATQGRVAAANLLGEELKYDQDKDCGVIFTRPQAAFVGLSVDQAKAKGMDAVEVKVPMSIDAKAMITGETLGLIKLVADKATQRIIGVHFLADHADTLIGEAVMMVSCGLTLTQVAHAIHPHPTQTELFGDLARRLLSRLRRSAKVGK